MCVDSLRLLCDLCLCNPDIRDNKDHRYRLHTSNVESNLIQSIGRV